MNVNGLRFLSNYLLIFCALFFFTSCESSKRIVYGLDQNEANEILVFLSSKGVNAEKIESTQTGGGGGSKITLWDISVKATDANEAMRQLNLQGLPRKRGANVLGIFSNSGLVSSDLQEKIKYRAALAEQLASTIRKYEGILDADVQISYPEEDPLNPGKTKGKITASVWIKHSGILNDPNSHLMTQIKRFVASSITGLNYDDVTVIGERSRVGDVPTENSNLEEDKQYVNIWSIVLAKESVSRFRWTFFTFCMLLLLMGLFLVWTLWKVHPLLNQHGGFKALLSVKPLHVEPEPPKIDETAAADAAKAETKKAEAKKNIEKDVDET